MREKAAYNEIKREGSHTADDPGQRGDNEDRFDWFDENLHAVEETARNGQNEEIETEAFCCLSAELQSV